MTPLCTSPSQHVSLGALATAVCIHVSPSVRMSSRVPWPAVCMNLPIIDFLCAYVFQVALACHVRQPPISLPLYICLPGCLGLPCASISSPFLSLCTHVFQGAPACRVHRSAHHFCPSVHTSSRVPWPTVCISPPFLFLCALTSRYPGLTCASAHHFYPYVRSLSGTVACPAHMLSAAFLCAAAGTCAALPRGRVPHLQP